MIYTIKCFFDICKNRIHLGFSYERIDNIVFICSYYETDGPEAISLEV